MGGKMEQPETIITHRELIIQIIEADDQGFMVIGGGARFTPQNLHSLIETIQNMVLASFGGKPGGQKDKKIQVDN